jgi:RimJ/RimL family protein N-acetyltransferase
MIRRVELADIEIFYRQQDDPVASELAAFPIRDRKAHDAHWARILADPTVTVRAIVDDGQVVGNIGSFIVEGERNIGYWLGREHWGRGHATDAVRALVDEVAERPLYAHVAEHNAASLRVLTKCGFEVIGTHQDPGDPIKELVLRLDS